MTNEQIEHMVSRFLSWKLPDDFSPDGGVEFRKFWGIRREPACQNKPTGTNLLNYPQAKAMVLHMITGLPEGDHEFDGPLTDAENAMIDAAWEKHKAARPDEPEVGASDVWYRGWECGYNIDAALWGAEGWMAYLGGADVDAVQVSGRTWTALLDEIDAHDKTDPAS